MEKLIMCKFRSSILALVICSGSFQSCKEVGPNISLRNNANVVSDTSYVESPVAVPELKNVVIEEFTGVRCPNCPQGHQIIAAIKSANPERVASVSFHPVNSLGIHYSFSADTFENSSAQILFDYMVQIGLEPAAGVDRIPSTGQSVLFEKNSWSTKVSSQLALTSPVNIVLSKTYEPTTRELAVVAELHYTKSVAEENKITIVLTESNITSAQLDGSVIDTSYIHNDVQRAFVSDIKGDLITQPLDAGRVVIKVYRTTLAAKWKPENMHILAYVHEFNNSKVIYQGKEIKVN